MQKALPLLLLKGFCHIRIALNLLPATMELNLLDTKTIAKKDTVR